MLVIKSQEEIQNAIKVLSDKILYLKPLEESCQHDILRSKELLNKRWDYRYMIRALNQIESWRQDLEQLNNVVIKNKQGITSLNASIEKWGDGNPMRVAKLKKELRKLLAMERIYSWAIRF